MNFRIPPPLRSISCDLNIGKERKGYYLLHGNLLPCLHVLSLTKRTGPLARDMLGWWVELPDLPRHFGGLGGLTR